MKSWLSFLTTLAFTVSLISMEKSPWKSEVTRQSELGNYSKAAVALDSQLCASVGKQVLERNGSAVDASIASLFCDSLLHCNNMGLGGGFFMTIYQKATGKVEILNARERAPLAATEDMFLGDPELSLYGGLAIAVPSQVKGLWEAKQKYGNPQVSWKSLIQPSINLCLEGIPVTFSMAKSLQSKKARIFKDPGMKDIFVNPQTQDVWNYGDVFFWRNLAHTLERIAENGADEFYLGETMEKMIEDLQSTTSIMTEEDFANMEISWEDPVSIDLGNGLQMHSTKPPGSGAILGFILNILQNYNFSPGKNLLQDRDQQALLYHRVVEAFKWAYGQRSNLGDPGDSDITETINQLVKNLTSEDYAYMTWQNINDSYTFNNASHYGADFFAPEDHGTTHLSVLAPNGDAVAVTSTINRSFGAVVMSPQTGIIFNNEMDDFSSPNVTNSFGVPPSPSNFIRPLKRPLSSTCPVIITEEGTGDVKMVSGAAGGTYITSQTALVMLRSLWLGRNLLQSTDDTRLHHQLAPMNIFYEPGLSQDIIEGLASRGHMLNMTTYAAVVNSITREKDGRIYAVGDYREMGGTDGF